MCAFLINKLCILFYLILLDIFMEIIYYLTALFAELIFYCCIFLMNFFGNTLMLHASLTDEFFVGNLSRKIQP